ncbi:AI-2E family transporter [Cellulomonas sp. WB94]|uniref:AI-2E family transporter n=1 Tax=Cellulomonas sp. WB94 TaxID=2173174 RepID=UPI000D584A8D|nr:AI-2E family transporter [Cellulomonas sp. WB94]PVU83534.1 AI-2E family transporter [Cellulomonas sp. WB94]
MTDDVTTAVPRPVRVSAAWSWRLLLMAAAVAVLFWVIAVLKTVIVPVAIALLVTIVLTPVVRWLQRRARLPRAAASGVALLSLLAVVGLLIGLAGSSIASGITELWQEAGEGIGKVTAWLAQGPLHLSAAQVDDYVSRIGSSISKDSGGLVTGALSVTTTVGHVAAGTLIAIFCTFFFLLDGRAIWAWVAGLLPLAAREPVHQAGRRALVTLGAYTRTQILVAFVDAVGIGVGAAVLRVPLALPLGIIVFVGSFIPIVGAVLTGSIAILVALVAQGPAAAVFMLIVVLAVQQLEGHVLQPFLMGHAVSMHPVAVLLVVATGSLVAGVVGALFAVPVAAVLNTVVLYLHGHDKFPALGDEDHVQIRGQVPAVKEELA